MGVSRATPASRSRAVSMSASVGTSNLEHLLHDLADGRERIELAALHLVEQPLELRVPGHRRLEVRLGSARRDGEDLASEVPAPPLLEAGLRQLVAMCLQRLPQLGDVLAA